MIDYNDDFWKWVEEHRGCDTTRLRFARRSDDPAWVEDAIAQIENERSASDKFAMELQYGYIPRLMPVKISVEQATSAYTAWLHYELSGLEPSSQQTVLDMTCGLGVDTSFLGRDGNTHVTSVELNERIARIAQYNFAQFPNINILQGNSIDYLQKSWEKYDVIFIDPARRDNLGHRMYNVHDCVPDVTEILPLMKLHLKPGGRIMIKLSPMLDVTQTLRDIDGVTSLHVIDDRGECRELLAIIDAGKSADTEPGIVAWCKKHLSFSFTQTQEREAQLAIAMPRVGQYLHEPAPAIMKAAPYKLLCSCFDIAKLHKNTHLYVGDDYHYTFPGNCYVIVDIQPYSSANLKRLSREELEADVAVRNARVEAQEVRKRLGIKRSGDTRIMVTTLADNKQYLLFLKHIYY